MPRFAKSSTFHDQSNASPAWSKHPAPVTRPTVDIGCFLLKSSSICGVRYLRVIGYCSMSQRATGQARESNVAPGQPQMEQK